MRQSRRTFLGRTIVAGAFLGSANVPILAARSVRPKLTFSEVFGDVRTEENVLQKGRLSVAVVMPLTGVSLKKINAETEFFVGLGDVTMAGTLGDDPRYRPGKKSVHIRDRGRDLRLEWNRRRLQVSLTIHTERGEPGSFAERYLPSPDGPIEGTAISFTSFAGRASRLDIVYKGEKVTRNGLRKVRLSGKGDTECGCG